MSNKDIISKIARDNDTFFTAYALLDTEINLNGYYYYTIKLRHNSSTVPMVRMDAQDMRLKYPINIVEVSVKKVNDQYVITSQAGDDSKLGTGDVIYRNTNGIANDITTERIDRELENQLIAREEYIRERLKEAQKRLDFELEKIYDPGGELRNKINAYIDSIKVELENGVLLIQSDLDKAKQKLTEVEAKILDIQNPAGTLRQQILSNIQAVKDQIEADNSVLNTRFKTAIQVEKQAREEVLTNVNQRLTKAEVDIDAINQFTLDIVNPGSPLRTKITNEIANVKAQIEAEVSVLDTQFNAKIKQAKDAINEIKTVDLVQITNPDNGLIKQAKDDLTQLMSDKDNALKSIIENPSSTLSNRIIEAKSDVENQLKPVSSAVWNLNEQINAANTGLASKVTKAITDIQDLDNNKAAKSVVDQLSQTVNGNSSSITTIQGVLASNGIDGSSNIAGKLSIIDTQINAGPNSLMSKITDLQNTKASKQDLAVEANRIHELEVATKYKDNLIKNPGLENDALYWNNLNGRVERLHYTDSRVPVNAPTTYVLRTNARDTMNKNRIPVAPGDTFYFSVWTAATETTTYDIRLMFVCFDKDGVVRNWHMEATHTPEVKNTWRKLEASFTVPNSKDYAYIEVGFQQERDHFNTDYNNSWYLALPELRQTNALKEVKGRITNVETVVGNASSGLVQRVNQLDSSINAPGVGINAKITDLTLSKANVADLNASNLRINSLESTTTALSRDIQTTNSRVRTLEETVSTGSNSHAKRLTNLETSITSGPDSLTSLRSSINSLSSSKADLSALNTQATRIDALESTVNTPGTGLNAKVTTLEETVVTGTNSLSKRLAGLESTVISGPNNLTSRVSTIESSKADKDTLNAESARITALDSRIGIDPSNMIANSVADKGTVGWVGNLYTTSDGSSPTPNVFAFRSRDNWTEIKYPVTPGEQYYLSAWTCTPIDHGVPVGIGVRAWNKDQSHRDWILVAQRAANDATGTWKQIKSVYTVPVGVAFISYWVQLEYSDIDKSWLVTKLELRPLSQNSFSDARITTLENTVSTVTSAHASRLEGLEASITTGPNSLDKLRSAIGTLETSKVDNNTHNAVAQRVSTLEAELTTGFNSLSNLRAGITNLENVVINGDNSHARKLSNLEAALHTPNTGVIARITSAEGAISNANAATAESFKRLEARLVSPANGMGVFNFADGFSSWVNDVYTGQTTDTTRLKIINGAEGKVATNAMPGQAFVGPKTRINIKPGMVVNAQFKYKRNTYNPAHQNNISFGFYALDKNMQPINGWPVKDVYVNREWTNQEWVSVNVDCAMDEILATYPRARYVVPFFLLNQSDNPTMAGPAEGMSLSGLELKDVTVPLRNKWVYRKYDGHPAYTLSNLENLDPIKYAVVDDSAAPVSNDGDNYVGRLTTQVYNKTGRQVTFTATHDDGGRIYVNGKEVYFNGVYTVNVNISFYIPAGWNTIDMIWNEYVGADGWSGISNLISNQVDLMGIGIDKVSATITEISNVAVDAQGKANAIRGIELDVNGKISGYKSINNGITSEFVVNADKFKVYNAAGGDQPVFVVGAVNGQNKLGLRADMIIDGSITADKLIIGNGINLLTNSDFSYGFNGWRWNTGSTTLASGLGSVLNAQIQSARQDWWNFGTTTLRIDIANGTPDAGVWFDSPTVGVHPGKWYYFQGVWAAHRTSGRVELDFLNTSEDIISRTVVQLPEYHGGPIKADWLNWSKKVQAPPGSVFARIRTVCSGVNQPNGDNAVIWVTQYMIEEVPEGATKPSGWKPGGSTVIDAGMIRTGYIGADRIAANSIHGDKITVDTLHGNRILGGTIIAGHIAAGNITTEHMNVNSINADRLLSRSITADKIKAGEITTQLLASNAVTADNIAAGAITASKLAIGNGENLIPNSTFTNNQTKGWHFNTLLQNGTWIPASYYGIVDQTHGEYTAYVEGGRGIYAAHNGSPDVISRIEIDYDLIPIAPDRNYIFSAHLSTHSSNGQVVIAFFNANRDYLTENGSALTEGNYANTMNGKKIPRYSVALRSPANAAFAKVIIRGWSRAGQNFPFVFVSKPMLELAPIGVTEPSPFNTGGSTLIDAGLIKTGIIEADRLDANIVRSKFLAAGKITANDIASQTITANELAVNSITTDKLNAGAVTAEKITTDAIRSHHIAAYQINAGKIDSNAIESRHIQTDAIEARMLKAGTITADKLAVGGNNLLSNTEFPNGMQAGWSVVSHVGRPYNAGFNGVGTWATEYFQGGTGMYLHYPSVTTDNPMGGFLGDLASDLIPVLAGYKYILSAHLSSHRCYGQVNIHWWNSNRQYIGEHSVSIPPNHSNVRGNPIPRVHIAQFAPANAAFAQARFRIHDATHDPYLFVSRPMFEQVAANTDLPSAYSAPGSTFIDAGVIKTGVIEADRLDANTIRAKLLSAPKIEAGDILVDGTVRARQIDTGNLKLSMFNPSTGRIMTTNIEPGAINTELLATNAVTADKIRAGSITADKMAIGGANLCINSVFGSNYVADWKPFGEPYDANTGQGQYRHFGGVNPNDIWINGDNGIYVRGKDYATDIGMYSPRIQILPNTRYSFSAVISAHRADTHINIYWYDANNNYIGAAWGNRDEASWASGPNPNAWSRGQAVPNAKIIATSPGNATQAELVVRSFSTTNDPYIFLSQPMFEVLPPSRGLTPSPYLPGGSLFLSGGAIVGNDIKTNMISTQYLRAEMLSAKKIDTNELAIVEQKNGNTVIKGTLIDKDGIFSTGNIVSQSGFYVLKPGSNKSVAVSDPKTDNRVAFGIGSDGNGFFSGDVYARNFVGTNSMLTGISEAERFKMRTKAGSGLDNLQRSSNLWDIIRSVNASGYYTQGQEQGDGEGNNYYYYYLGQYICTVSTEVPASDYRTIIINGNLMFSFNTTGGYDVTNYRFRAEDDSGNVLGWASVNSGQWVTQVCIVPITLNLAPLSSVGTGYQTRTVSINVKYVDNNYNSPVRKNTSLVPNPSFIGIQLIA